jgi:5,5'-dehydrodivanillate O-demethylase oxygenase subunit
MDAQAAPKRRIDNFDLVRTGPGTLAGRYMRLFWQPVYRSEDLLARHAKPLRIMSTGFTLYRDEHGVAHAIGFRCSHRGTQLSVGYVEGDCIRCFYHGWLFNPQGECVERPAEKTPATERHQVPGYPTQEYLGLIFVYFGEGEPPPLPRFRRMEDEGIHEVTIDVMPANFFFSLENSALHFNFVHRDLMEEKGLRGLPQVRSEESDFGITKYTQWPSKSAPMISQKGMPNVGYIVPLAIMMAKRRNYQLHVSWRVPVDDESHTTFRVTLTPLTGDEAERVLAGRSPSYHDRASIREMGDAVIAGKLRIADIEDRTHIEFIQDYVAQVGQGPVSTRSNEQLASSDSSESLFRRIWRRELTALAEGRPLKHWRVTEKIEPSLT